MNRYTMCLMVMSLVGVITADGAANAAAVPGISGSVVNPTSSTLLCPRLVGNQGVQNSTTCGGFITWSMPLPANQGSKTITVNGTCGSVGMTCTAYATNQDGSSATVSSSTLVGTNVNRAMTATVPGNGALSLQCVIPQSCEIHTVNYDF